MNRAFVQPDDADASDSTPELPPGARPNYVTARGLAQLRARQDDAERRLAASDIEPADIAQRADAERELRWLQARIGHAVLIEPASQPPDRVGFGALVELVDDRDQHHRYRIVGEDEADPERGCVSWASPLARALHGARVGDSVTWRRPAGDLEVEVLAIEYPDDPAPEPQSGP